MSSAPQDLAAGLQARPMCEADLDAVMAIERVIYPFPWTRGNFGDSLRSGYDAWLFASPDEPAVPILGYAVLMRAVDEVHLLNISVVAARQGRGHGRRILGWLCRDAAARGVRSMLLEVRPSNLPALKLYESSGFERLGLRRGYYPAEGGLREDALVLRRMLADG